MHTSDQQIEIPLNKSKIVLMLAGSLAFVAIGVWFIIAPPTIENSYWGSPAKLTILGYAAILFFGIVAFVLIRKLPDPKPGLTIDDNGMVDNSGGLAAGRILWSDIEEITVLEIQSQKMIMIHVANPQQYIERQKNIFKRKGLEMNNRMYGTPISISVNALKTSLDELFHLLRNKLQQARAT